MHKLNVAPKKKIKATQEKTGYELPEDLKYKQERLDKIKSTKEALEQREKMLCQTKRLKIKKQISFADTDVRIMGKKGDFDYRYNAQISVDADLQIIVGQHISLNANDKQEMLPALEAIQGITGRLPEQMSADNGVCPVITCKHWQTESLMRISLRIKVKNSTQLPWMNLNAD